MSDPASDPASPRASQEYYAEALQGAEAAFPRLSEEGRTCLKLAEEQARVLDDNHVGTEHVVLGLMAEGRGLGAKALESLGITRDVFIAQLYEEEGPSPPGRIPFTARGLKIIAFANQEAERLGHDLIDSGHILLGVVGESEDWAMIPKLGPFHLKKAAASVGLGLEDVRMRVVEFLRKHPSGSD